MTQYNDYIDKHQPDNDIAKVNKPNKKGNVVTFTAESRILDATNRFDDREGNAITISPCISDTSSYVTLCRIQPSPLI